MTLPRHVPSSAGSGDGHGPFGDKAFKGALIGCVVLVAAGAAMVAAGGESLRAAGVALIAVCGLGLLTGGAGLLAERVLKRTPPPPPDVRGSNGHGRYPEQQRRRSTRRR